MDFLAWQSSMRWSRQQTFQALLPSPHNYVGCLADNWIEVCSPISLSDRYLIYLIFFSPFSKRSTRSIFNRRCPNTICDDLKQDGREKTNLMTTGAISGEDTRHDNEMHAHHSTIWWWNVSNCVTWPCFNTTTRTKLFAAQTMSEHWAAGGNKANVLRHGNHVGYVLTFLFLLSTNTLRVAIFKHNGLALSRLRLAPRPSRLDVEKRQEKYNLTETQPCSLFPLA